MAKTDRLDTVLLCYYMVYNDACNLCIIANLICNTPANDERAVSVDKKYTGCLKKHPSTYKQKL